MANSNDISIGVNFDDTGANRGLEMLIKSIQELVDITKKQIDFQVNASELINAQKTIEETNKSVSGLSTMADVVSGSFVGIIETVRNFDGSMSGLVKTIISVSAQLLLMPFSLLVPAATSFIDVLGGIGRTMISLIGGFGGFIDSVMDIGKAFLSIPVAIGSGVISGITGVFSALSGVGSGIVSAILEPIKSIGSAIGNIMTTAFSSLSGIGSTIASVFGGIANLIIAPFKDFGSILMNIGSMIGSAITAPVSTAVGLIKGMWSAFSEGVNFLGNIGNILSMFTSLKDMIGMVTDSLSTMGKAIVGTLGEAIGITRDFNKQISNIASVTGASKDEMNKLRTAALQVGKDTSLSSSQAANALYALGSAGLSSKNSIAALNGTAKLAEATQSDLTVSTELVVSSLTQYGLEASKATDMANVFSAGINISQLNMNRLADSMKYVGPVAGNLGMSIESTVGILSALSNAGIMGEQAGTALRGALTTLINPTTSVNAVLQSLNLSLEQVNPTTKSFGDIIETLKERGISTAQTMQMFGDVAGPSMLALLNQGGQGINDLTAKVTGTQAAFDAAQIQLDNFAGASLQLSGSIETLQIMFGTVFQTALQIATTALLDVVNGMINFLDKSQILVTMETVLSAAFTGLYSAIGLISPIFKTASDGVALFFNALSTSVQYIVDFISKSQILKTGFIEIEKAVENANTSFQNFFSGIVGFDSAFSSFQTNATATSSSMDSFGVSATTAGNTVGQSFIKKLDPITFSSFASGVNQASMAVSDMGNKATASSSGPLALSQSLFSAEAGVKTYVGALSDWARASETQNSINNLLKVSVSSLKDIILSFGSSFTQVVQAFIGGVSQIGGTTKFVAGQIDGVANSIKQLSPIISKAIIDIGNMATSWVKSGEVASLAKGMYAAVISVFTMFKDVLMSIPEIVSLVTATFSALTSQVGSIIPIIGSIINSIANLVGGFAQMNTVAGESGTFIGSLQTIIVGLIDIFGAAARNILGFAASILQNNQIMTALQDIIAAVISAFTSLTSSFSGNSSVIQIFVGYFSTILTVFAQVAKSAPIVINSITAAFSLLAPQVMNIVSILVNFVASLFGVGDGLSGTSTMVNSFAQGLANIIGVVTRVISAILTFITNILTQTTVLETLRGIIMSVVSVIQNLWATLTSSSFIATATGYFNAFMAVIGLVGTTITQMLPSWDQIKASVLGFGQTLVQVATVYWPQIQTAFQSFMTAVMQIVDFFQSSITPALQSVSTAISQFVSGDMAGALTTLGGLFASFFPTLAGIATAGVTAFTGAFTTSFTTGYANITASINAGNQQAAQGVQQLPSAFATVGLAISSTLVGLAAVIITSITGTLSTVSNTIIPAITSFVNGLGSGFKAGFATLPAELQTGMTVVWNGLKMAFMQGVTILTVQIPLLFDAITKKISEWFKKEPNFAKDVEEFFMSLYTAFDNVFTKLADYISIAIIAITPALIPAFATLGQGIGKVAGSLLILIGTFILAAAPSFVTGVISTFTNAFTQVTSGITGTMTTGFGILGGAVGAIIQGFGTTLIEFFGRIFAGNAIILTLQQWFPKIGSALETGFNDLITKLLSLFGKLSLAFPVTGRAITEGISQIGEVLNVSLKVTAGRIVGGILAFGELIIKSFSGVFDAVFAKEGGGFAAGFDKFLSNITKMFTIDLAGTLTTAITGISTILFGWPAIFIAALGPITKALYDWSQKFDGTWKVVIQILTVAGAAISGFLVGGPIGAAFAAFIALLPGISDALKKFGVDWDTVWNTIKTSAAPIAAAVVSIGAILIGGIAAWPIAVVAGLTLLGTSMFNYFAENGMKWAIYITSALVVAGSAIVLGIAAWPALVLGAIVGLGLAIYNYLIGHSLIDDIPMWFGQVFDAVIASFGAIGSSITTAFMAIWDGLKSAATTIMEYGKAAGQAVIDGIMGAINAGISLVKGAMDGIIAAVSGGLQTVTDLAGKAADIAKNIGSTIANAASAVANAAVAPVAGVASAAGSMVASAEGYFQGNTTTNDNNTSSEEGFFQEHFGGFFANGGIVGGSQSGTPVVVGDKGRAEGIVPLSDNRSIPVSFINMPDFSALTAAANSGGTSINLSFGDINISNDQDEKQFLQKVENAINDAMRRMNGRR